MRYRTILMAVMLAGCASRQGDYPSLAHRAVEDGNFDEPVRAAPVLAPDPALDRRIATLSASLAEAIAAFDGALPAAERRAEAARGKPAGSDAWVDAQQALAALDDGRARIAALATDADAAASARAATLEPAYPALDTLDAKITQERTREGETVARLQAMLAPG